MLISNSDLRNLNNFQLQISFFKYCDVAILRNRFDAFNPTYENKGKEEAQMKCAKTRQRKHENAQGQP